MSVQWFAVQAKPRQEGTAKEQLQRQGYTAYLPMMTVRKRSRAAWTTSIEPLFPRYLFINADISEQSLAPVRSTVGVSGLIRFGNLLRPVPDAVVHYLQQAEAAQSSLSDEESWPFRAGDKVAVLEGPFAGLTAVFEGAEPEARAMILLELLGRQNTVEVPIDALNAL
jgi:transcriptional antiterminator RfaH